jgi:hypothetical protein
LAWQEFEEQAMEPDDRIELQSWIATFRPFSIKPPKRQWTPDGKGSW